MKVVMGNELYPEVMGVRRKSPNWTIHLPVPLFFPMLGREQHMSQSTPVPRLASTRRRKMWPVKCSNTGVISKVSPPQRKKNSSQEEVGWCLPSGDDELSPETQQKVTEKVAVKEKRSSPLPKKALPRAGNHGPLARHASHRTKTSTEH